MNTTAIADRFPIMHESILSWTSAHRQFTTTATGPKRDPNATEIGAMSFGGKFGGKGDGKYAGKSDGKYGGKSDGKYGGKGDGKYGDKSDGKYGYGGKSKNFKGRPPPAQCWQISHYLWQDPWKSSGKADKSKPPRQFSGHCGKCWMWGHKKAQCPDSRPTPMDVGSLSSTAAPSSAGGFSKASSDIGSSVSARIGAVTIAENDDGDWPCAESIWEDSAWHDDWCPSPWHKGPESWPPWLSVPWEVVEDEKSWLVRAISSATTRSQDDGNAMKLMIDSGSQSTAVNAGFAPNYAIDSAYRHSGERHRVARSQVG